MTNQLHWEGEPDLGKLAELHGLLTREPSRALDGLELLAKRGSAASTWYLADAYMGQGGAPKDLAKAIHWFEEAQRKGIVQATHMLGRIFFENRDYAKAFSEFSAGASSEYPPSIYRLALLFKDGTGTRTDLDRYEGLLLRAASKGHLFAKRDLMAFYLSGRCGARKVFQGFAMLFFLTMDIVRLKFEQHDEDFDERVVC